MRKVVFDAAAMAMPTAFPTGLSSVLMDAVLSRDMTLKNTFLA